MKSWLLTTILLLSIIFSDPISAISPEDTITLSLQNAVDLAVMQSSSVRNTQNRNVNYYWRYKNFQSRSRPQLVLSGNLPNYAQTTSPITQPDGSVEFKQVANAQTSANLSLNQSIPFLGTQVYASSSVYRIRDFNNSATEFSGTPFSIGFVQPLFAYNWMKWSNITEPLLYEEANKDFVESIEEISLETTQRFFRYLKVQTNFNLSTSNLKNSKDNLKIAEAKRQLGQISENDFSRIQLSVFNAQKALNKSQMDLKNADFELKSYIGLDQDISIILKVPLNIIFFDIDPEKALNEALSNRKETPRFKRRLAEADRQLDEAKKNSGINATLRGSYGVTNSAEFFPEIYQNPEKEQIIRLTLSVPILDWGRTASTIKLAESQKDLVVYDVEKDKMDFEREISVQVEQFGLLKDQLKTATEADKVAENGYLIALRKFQNGEISITDLNISLQERESAKRDYIDSIKDYWEAYYNLRILTLYDFELNQKISYLNPQITQN
ncbi:MAG: TolC family protein [Bacteroidales bacterium]|nr:TolC family protein [Bacteroidales bacterium]MCB8998622.1 TolC family protein [Bacteroidales bacterium]MCB9012510.1 TolC family protein [Bacteroidales bacterium]